jgi:hypothetical protein
MKTDYLNAKILSHRGKAATLRDAACNATEDRFGGVKRLTRGNSMGQWVRCSQG